MVDDQWVGAELAGYRSEALIGRGGAGVVYRATHLRLQRPAAVKLLAAGLATDAEYRRRFEREARLAASLDHDHIVPIYDAGYGEGVLYLAMRHIDGPNLATVIENGGPMDLHRVCGLLAGVAEALDGAHRAGLVHRDVKPANVLLTEAGRSSGRERAYLCDFGIARHAATSSALTATGQFLGTLQYCAPEQIQGQLIDGRADQYALACVIYHCLTGRVPYPADEPAAAMFAHISAEPPRASAHKPTLPPAVDDIIARALAKQPAQRYPDCAAFLDALATADNNTVTAVPRPIPSSPPPAVDHTVIWPPTPGHPSPRQHNRPTGPARTPNGATRLGEYTLPVLAIAFLALIVFLAAVVAALPSRNTGDPTRPSSNLQSAPSMTTTATPPTTSAPGALAIGDPRSVDHRAFLNPAQFAGFGRAYAGPRI